MLFLFALTLFASALLLFLVQPMVAKMVLPLLGGSPAVWNTCVLFFQATLLAGYLYAHWSIRILGVRRQAVLHLVVMMLPVFTLPIALASGWSPPMQQNPTWWLLGLLLVSVGLPFFAVSTSGPLLQKWFATTDAVGAHDPYFLYAASNLGSMAALMAYPMLLEPRLLLAEQSVAWTLGYLLLLLLTAGCAFNVWRSARVLPSESPWQDATDPDLIRKVSWVALAFIPSSLMLGVTTYLTTDIAAVPLLWIIPLGLYLLTFVVAFGRMPARTHLWLIRAFPLVLVPWAALTIAGISRPHWAVIPLHLAGFFLAGLLCHGHLALGRPATRHLTGFYLWIAVGGVLGGLFNTAAPILFNAIVEYPISIALMALAWMAAGGNTGRRFAPLPDVVFPVVVVVTTFGLASALRPDGGPGAAATGLLPLLFLPAMLWSILVTRPIPLVAAVVLMLLANNVVPTATGDLIHTERSFFGVHRVSLDRERNHRLLFHGTTLHGRQSLDADAGCEPLTYYHRTGPIGQVFEALTQRPLTRVAVVGLGTGSLACYGRPGERWTFYEIDAAVEQIARDGRYFTFLRDSPAAVDVVLGDARLSLADSARGPYDLIVLDAFSSDAIPVHLLTREAVAIYRGRLAPGGLLAVHISNRYLDLGPVLEALAREAGLVALLQRETHVDAEDQRLGKVGSDWVLMAGDRQDVVEFAGDTRWTPLNGSPSVRAWTDDFSNIVGVFRWR